MKRQKILHITTHFYPFIGGLENMTFDLAKHQAQQHEVTVLTCQYDKHLPLFEEIDGVKIYRFPSIEILKNQYSVPKFGFSKKIKIIKPDYIFTHTRFFMTSFLGGFHKKKAQWIHIEHGQNFVRSKNHLIASFAWLFDQSLGRYILKKADKVIVLGSEGKQFVQQFRGNRPIMTIQNGVKIPQKILNPPRKNKVVFFGRCIPEKGIYEILEAAKQCPNWFFDLYGESSINCLLPNVKFHGKVDPTKISEKIQKADLILLPSWSEGNSLAILEAAANRRPILATPVGQNENIVSPFFIVPVKNTKMIIKKLHQLHHNWEKLEAEGHSNLEKVRQLYAFNDTMKEYDRLIKQD